MKLGNVIKENMKEITELWNLSLKIGDLKSLKEKGNIEIEKRTG